MFTPEFPRMISLRARFELLLIFCLTLFFLEEIKSADWPQWRGPDRTGHVAAGERLPTRLPDQLKIVWRMKVGEGLASPVVAGGKAFYFDAVNKKETLHAIDALTAKELWRATIDDTFADMQGPAGPRCTPVIDGDRVYAVSCKGELQCREVSDGKLLWHVNYTNDFSAIFIGEKGPTPGAARHGNNGSPLIVGDHLYACVGGTNGEGVVCFAKKTGKVIWKSQNDQAAYAPPVLATLAGVPQVVCFNVTGLIGLALDNGDLLWRMPVKTALARHVTTPVFADDMVVVASHQAGLIGTKISKETAGLKAQTEWVHKELAMNFSSPVVVGKYLFGLGPAKNLICVEIATGKLMWSKDGYFTTSADKAHASFLVFGKNVLVLTDGGELLLMAADAQEFHEISRSQACGLNWCNPAYVGGKLYLRDGIKTSGELWCVSLIE